MESVIEAEEGVNGRGTEPRLGSYNYGGCRKRVNVANYPKVDHSYATCVYMSETNHLTFTLERR